MQAMSKFLMSFTLHSVGDAIEDQDDLREFADRSPAISLTEY